MAIVSDSFQKEPAASAVGRIVAGATASSFLYTDAAGLLASTAAGNSLPAGTTSGGVPSAVTTLTPTFAQATITGAVTNSTDTATKGYVDNIFAGFSPKSGCVCATTAALTVTYANGSSGVGATLTNAGALAAFSIDGVSPTATQRVLIKNQASGLQNGIYIVTTVGSGAVAWVLTRATDYDTAAEIHEADYTEITQGTANATTLWEMTQTAVVVVGTTAITWAELLVAAQTVTLTGDVTGTGAGSFATTYALNVPMNRGGMNAALVANNGGIFYSTATAGAILAGTATINQMLLSGSNAAPAWSTATYPATTTVSQLLYSSAANTVAGLATANNAILITSNTGVPSLLTGGGANGQVPISASGAPVAWATLTQVANQTSISVGANSITIGTVQGIGTASTPQFARMGIGVAADATFLLTVSNNAADVHFNLASTAAGGRSWLLAASGTANVTANGGLYLYDNTAAAYRLIIGSTGTFDFRSNIISSATWNGATVGVAYGGTGNTTFTAYSVVCAGTTAQGTFQNVVGVGAATQVLTSNGAGALPTWQAVAPVATSVSATSDGTAALPIITRSTDTNTGLYFAAADSLGYTTGGVEQMRQTVTGVGISNTGAIRNPSGLFDLTSNAGGTLMYMQTGVTSAGSPGLEMRKSRGTVAAPTVITTGDNLGILSSWGHVGAVNGFIQASQVLFTTEGTISDAAGGIGGAIQFNCRKTGDATLSTYLTVYSNGDVVVGNAALATNATGGFPFVSSCAGKPTGVPTTRAGRVPDVHDSTNNIRYTNNGSWGAVGTHVLISSQTADGTASTITFSSIPGGFRDLLIIWEARSDKAAVGYEDGTIGFNADVGANYDWAQVRGNNGSVSYDSTFAATSFSVMFAVTAASATANNSACGRFIIYNYATTTWNKKILGENVRIESNNSLTTQLVHTVGQWRSTAAVTSIVFTLPAGKIVNGSTFALYGIV